MSERWRDTYDQWKLREPDEGARVCDACGRWLRYDWHCNGWYCEACDERDALRDAE